MYGFADGLLDEQPYSLTVNGRNLASVMMLAGFEKEFAAGYLTTEGIVPFAEIESVMVDSNTISVLTVNPLKVLLPKKAVISGCGGTASYLDSVKMPKVSACAGFEVPSANFENEAVVRAGGFGAMICSGGFSFEVCDISQISAVNKCVGSALYNSVNLSGCVLQVSGKVTADVVRMCRFAGISRVVSLFPPTALAKSAADDGGVKLVF